MAERQQKDSEITACSTRKQNIYNHYLAQRSKYWITERSIASSFLSRFDPNPEASSVKGEIGKNATIRKQLAVQTWRSALAATINVDKAWLTSVQRDVILGKPLVQPNPVADDGDLGGRQSSRLRE
jgi:hypothetical protein